MIMHESCAPEQASAQRSWQSTRGYALGCSCRLNSNNSEIPHESGRLWRELRIAYYKGFSRLDVPIGESGSIAPAWLSFRRVPSVGEALLSDTKYPLASHSDLVASAPTQLLSCLSSNLERDPGPICTGASSISGASSGTVEEGVRPPRNR